MRGCSRWALDTGHVTADPTVGRRKFRCAKRLTVSPSGPRTTLPDTRAPLAGRHERARSARRAALHVDYDRGDAVRLGRQHVRDGVATIKTEKTDVTVSIPILPALAATLAAGPCGELAFVCGEAGKPLTKESFGNAFREACRAAGVAKSAHGVRKSERRARPRMVRPSPNSRQSSAGKAGGMAQFVHTRGRSSAACQGRDREARENGRRTFYSRTYGKGRDSAPKRV